MSDQFKNFAKSRVAVAPSPATTGTSLTVTTGHGSRFPTAPFNVTIWPIGRTPDPTNAEIATCTDVTGDVLTIVRAQEYPNIARTVIVGDQVAQTMTRSFMELFERGVSVKAFGAKGDDSNDDTAEIQAAIDSAYTSGGGAVYFPKGTYRISDTIDFKYGVSLLGDSAIGMWAETDENAVVRIKWVGADEGVMFDIPNRWNGRLENFYMDGNFLAATMLRIIASQSAIYRNLIIRRTTATNTGTYAVILTTDGATSPSWPTQFPSAGFNLFENVIIHDLGGTGGVLFDGTEAGSPLITTAAVTLNTLLNCKIEGGANHHSLVFNQCCDNNWMIGGSVSGPQGAVGIVLNFSTTNDETYANNFLAVAIENVHASGTGIDARNNVAHNQFIGCFLPTQGTPYTTTQGAGGGKIKATGCFHGTSGSSFASMTSPSPGASPWTYTNEFIYPIEFEMWGGTISQIQRIRNGSSSGIGGTFGDYRNLLMEPGDGVEITYTVAPTIQITPH